MREGIDVEQCFITKRSNQSVGFLKATPRKMNGSYYLARYIHICLVNKLGEKPTLLYDKNLRSQLERLSIDGRRAS
jgi:hypothetical protein